MNYSEDFKFVIERIVQYKLILKSLDGLMDYIDIEDVKSISYLPINKIEIVKFEKLDPYNNKYRKSKKFGSIVNNIFNYYSMVQIESFVLLFKRNVKILKNLFFLKIVDGEEIRYWYNEDNNVNIGVLGNSCMKYKSQQQKFDIYVNNPDFCKMLILKENESDDKITGRALLWKTNIGWYMDRIYTSYNEDVGLFFKYGKNHNINLYYKDKNNYKMFVRLGRKFNPKSNNYPYMDTFKYYYYFNGIITNKHSYYYPMIVLNEY